MDYLNGDVLNDVLNSPMAGNISSLADSAFHFDFDHGPQVQAGQTHAPHDTTATRTDDTPQRGQLRQPAEHSRSLQSHATSRETRETSSGHTEQ